MNKTENKLKKYTLKGVKGLFEVSKVILLIMIWGETFENMWMGSEENTFIISTIVFLLCWIFLK